MFFRLFLWLLCLCVLSGLAQEGFITNVEANGKITFTGSVFHITQPGASLAEDLPVDMVPVGQWVLSGSWMMEIDPDLLAITKWEHNMVMLRAREGGSPLPNDVGGNPTRASHTVQLVLRDGRVRSLDFGTGLGRITGTMETMKNGQRQFSGESVEILLVGGGGFKGMTNLEIRFLSELGIVTSATQGEDVGNEARNAREYFGDIILGTVKRISFAE